MSNSTPTNRESGKRILVADDNAAVLSMLTVMLERLGYSVITASDGVAAVDLFEQEKDSIDMLVLDVMMPKMKGTAVAAHIRRQRPELPLLFISGYADHVQYEEMEHLGEYTLIPKPLSIAYLGQTIQAMLKG